jgi:hypothetical protein
MNNSYKKLELFYAVLHNKGHYVYFFENFHYLRIAFTWYHELR